MKRSTKIGALLIALCMLFSIFSLVSAEAVRKVGDTNNDTIINGKDVLLLRKHIVGLDTIDDERYADCTGDGAVNGKDVLLLRKYIVGLTDEMATIPEPSTETPTTTQEPTTENDENTIIVSGKEYKLTFIDEFDGTELDSTKWSRCPEWGRQGNYCYWENDMTTLDGEGHLVLSADYDDGGILRCGAVRTRDKFYQKYGYFEITVKLQSTAGFWSAFWLMPDNIDTGIVGGSDGTEIDIYEAFDVKNSKINQAVHFDGYGSNHKAVNRQVTADVYDGEFHTFALEWTERAYRFYIDGERVSNITNADVDIANVANYMKISLESGSWTGQPDASKMPDGIVVDKVCVYQRTDLFD